MNITMELTKSNKTNINEKAKNLLNPAGYALHQALSAKMNDFKDIRTIIDFATYSDLANAINFTLESLQEGLTNLYDTGYLIYHKDILKFYQNGTVSSKDPWSLVSSMMNDNYYIVREWMDREVF